MIEELNEIESLMAEPPGGENHGRKAVEGHDLSGAHTLRQPLNVHDLQVRDFQIAGGWTVQQGHQAGGTAHRGVLMPGEHVDVSVLRSKVEAGLGFTYAQISAVYSPGRLAASQRQLRARIDARLLALSRAGGNMALLAKVLDLSEKTLDRALARARQSGVTSVGEGGN